MTSKSQPTDLPSPPHSPRPHQAALTPRQYAILPLIILSTKDDPSSLGFDWPALAQRMGMQNPRSAANAWLAAKKKILTAAGSSSASPKLTPHESRFLAAAVACTKFPLQIDAAALAARLGMTNAGSARNAWTALRKKLGASGGPCAGNLREAVEVPKKQKDVVVLGSARSRRKRAKAAVAAVRDEEAATEEVGSSEVNGAQERSSKAGKWRESSDEAWHQFVGPRPEPSGDGSATRDVRENPPDWTGYASEDLVRVKEETYYEC